MIYPKNSKKIPIALFLLAISILSVSSAEELQTNAQPTGLQTAAQLTQLDTYYYPSLNNPSNFVTWNNNFCNKSDSMDFLIELTPEACQPNPVTSDLLEETDVPVLCKLTGIKINPFIEVPYIKKIQPIIENQSPQISFINFYPARSALGFYQFSDYSSKVKQSTPTLSNLGYLQVSLKQQPIESKMPKNVSAKITVNITYDVAKTYGINTQQFVLPVMSQQEWLDRYKKYSFWQNRGYLRLQEVKGQNAKISLYTNADSQPILTEELREGESLTKRLPGFYCQEEVKITLDKIDIPRLKARLVVNGDDLIVEEGEEIADSGCVLDKITTDKFNYGGEVSVSCMGSLGKGETGSSILKLNPIKAKINVIDSKNPLGIEKEFTVGDEIVAEITSNGAPKKEYYYVAHIGKLAKAGKTLKTTEFASFVVIFAVDSRLQLDEEQKEKIIQAIQDYIKGSQSPALGSSYDIKSSVNEDSRAKINEIYLIEKGQVRETIPSNGVKFEPTSIEGAKQTYYSASIEKEYQSVITQYRSITNQFPALENPSGGYYGIRALRQASELSAYLFKEADQINFLQEIVDKYQESDDEYIQAEVEDAKLKIFELSYGAGEKSVVKNTDKGTYYISLISIDKPGYNSQQTTLRLNDVQGTYIVGDKIKGDSRSDWTIVAINDDDVVFSWSNPVSESITKGSYKFLNTTRVEVVNTLIKREVKVTVWPFEKERTTSTNFSLVIGIEKRAIQLTPKQIEKRIEDLNKKIEVLNKYVTFLEKTTTTWKNLCYSGGSILWLKNFILGASGQSFARRYVMKAWSEKCASEEYRSTLGNNNLLSVSQCYKKNSADLNKDVSNVASLANDANDFIKKIKSKPGVVTSSGLLGLSKQINEDKFMEEAKNLFSSDEKASALKNDVQIEVKLIKLTSQQKQRLLAQISEIEKNYPSVFQQTCAGTPFKDLLELTPTTIQANLALKNCVIKIPINVEKVIDNLPSLSNQGMIFSDDIKEIYLILAINEQGEGISSVLKDYNNLKMIAKFDYFNNIVNEIENKNSQKELGLDIPVLQGDKSQTLKVSSIQSLEEIKSRINPDNHTLLSSYPDKSFKIFIYSNQKIFAILDPAANSYYTYHRAFYWQQDKNNIITLLDEITDGKDEKGIERIKDLPAVLFEDINSCKHEIAKEDFTIRFWDKQPYEGLIAYMPITRNEGWYFATKAYSGMEGKLVSWKDTGAINEYWICNVGPNGKPDFDFYKGAGGDDGCCFQISKTTGMEVPEEIKALTDKVEKECIQKAIDSYNKKENPINAGLCGRPSLGKSPILIPSTQCEDFMSPEDCSILFNLCDPVICPSSRCDFSGRLPVENVIQSGIVGSLFLCSGNKEVILPVCISGLYNGLDSLNNMILKQYKECLQKQLDSGQTTGICDQFHSFYMCQLLWNNVDPLLKAGLPMISESLNNGGGEYSLFSEAIKNSQDSIGFFTKNYGSNTFNLFKQRATNQKGTTFCDRYFSIVVPTTAKFLEDLTKADSYYQMYASVDEVSMGASPESQYRVFYDIYAGKDTPISYYVYLRKQASSQQSANEYEQLSVKDSFGFLAIGQTVSEKKDFIAPSGYNEICININGKDFCGFGSVSTSFLVEEVQNIYLSDQIKKNIKTEKECKAGSATLMPTPSLSLQSQIQEHLEPEIYRRGIIRICASNDPGKTAEPGRYQRIGYCDDIKIGCWLDMNSVNASISDLGIRKDIENYSKEKTIEYLLETDAIDPVEKTASLINTLLKELEDIEKELFGSSKDYENKEGIYGKYNKRISDNVGNSAQLSLIKEEINKDPIIQKIENLLKQIPTSVLERTLNLQDKAQLEWIKAQALQDKLRILALADTIISAKATSCEEFKGQWYAQDKCSQDQEDRTSDCSDKTGHPNQVCCVESRIIRTIYLKWPVEGYGKIISYLNDLRGGDPHHEGIDIQATQGTSIYSVYNGKVVYAKNDCNCQMADAQNCGGKYGNYLVIEHLIGTKKLYSLYAHLDSTLVNENTNVNTGQLIAKMGKTGNSCNSGSHLHFETHLYNKDESAADLNNPSKKIDPLCLFSMSDLESAKVDKSKYDAGKCEQIKQLIGFSGTTTTIKPGTCSDYLMKDTCNEKAGCFWDSSVSKCNDCPKKCEGERDNLLDIARDWRELFNANTLRARIFTTKEDCLVNGCNLNCIWLESDKRCYTPSSLTREQIQRLLSQINTMSDKELNTLKNAIQSSSLDPSFKNQAVSEIDKRLAQLQTGTTPNPATSTGKIDSVILVSNVNSGQFTSSNKLVAYSDSVKVCAVVTESSNKYSSEEVSGKNNLDIRKWPYSEQPTFNWYIVSPDFGPYDGTKLKDGQETVTFSQKQVSGNSWCIENNEIGTNRYRVEATIQGIKKSSLGAPVATTSKIEQGAYDSYLNDVQDLLLVSRKSSNTNNYLATIDSFKNLPFIGGICFLQTSNSIAFSFAKLYKGMECIALVTAALEKSYNTELPVSVHDNIANFIDRFGILEVNGQKIEKIRINELAGMAIPIEEGDLIFLFSETKDDYDHSMVVYKNNGNQYLELDDEVVYTSSGCISGGSEESKTGMIKVENGLCYTQLRRFSAMNSQATIVRVSGIS